jgi:hypothetical protein
MWAVSSARQAPGVAAGLLPPAALFTQFARLGRILREVAETGFRNQAVQAAPLFFVPLHRFLVAIDESWLFFT